MLRATGLNPALAWPRAWTGVLAVAALLLGSVVQAGGEDQTGVEVYKSPYDFDASAANLRNAILTQGLVISNTLHVHDMLARTAPDLNFAGSPYTAAIAHEFCSASISHRMIARDIRNLATCPFTIAVYTPRDEPDQTYLAFQRKVLAGDADDLEQEIFELLDAIVQEAIF